MNNCLGPWKFERPHESSRSCRVQGPLFWHYSQKVLCHSTVKLEGFDRRSTQRSNPVVYHWETWANSMRQLKSRCCGLQPQGHAADRALKGIQAALRLAFFRNKGASFTIVSPMSRNRFFMTPKWDVWHVTWRSGAYINRLLLQLRPKFTSTFNKYSTETVALIKSPAIYGTS